MTARGATLPLSGETCCNGAFHVERKITCHLDDRVDLLRLAGVCPGRDSFKAAKTLTVMNIAKTAERRACGAATFIAGSPARSLG
jgi:hypothetical protein